jgi:hypothetical protein
MGLAARFFGIVVSPRDTFHSVAAHPRWLGMLVVVTVVIAVMSALPMTTEAGKEAALRSQVGRTWPGYSANRHARGI